MKDLINVNKKLYSIKRQHKTLSEIVMNYILKKFSLMIIPNKGDVEIILYGRTLQLMI